LGLTVAAAAFAYGVELADAVREGVAAREALDKATAAEAEAYATDLYTKANDALQASISAIDKMDYGMGLDKATEAKVAANLAAEFAAANKSKMEADAADDVIAARVAITKAEDAKAPAYSPVFYNKSQELLEVALAAMDKGDYPTTSMMAKGAAMLAGYTMAGMTQAQGSAADDVIAARIALTRAEDGGAAVYAADVHGAASQLLDSALTALDKEDYVAASKNANDAAFLANLASGWRSTVEGRAADDVIAARVALDQAKSKGADRSSPAVFKMAEGSLNEALSALDKGDYPAASSSAMNAAIIANALAGRM